jgi:hypothetical protein
MKTFLCSSLVALAVSMTGCASFSTIPITRSDSNSVSGDSNGAPRWFCRSRPYKGIPIKVLVQTHVDVFIEEEFLLSKGEKYESWKETHLENKFLNVRIVPVSTDQIVISDFKRPASGTIDLTVDFTDTGYLEKIESNVTDTTIKDSAALLSTIISNTSGSASGKASLRNDQRLDWKKRTLAYQRFDINAPDYEEQLDAFINHHVNGCNQCNGFPTYDRVLATTSPSLTSLGEQKDPL